MKKISLKFEDILQLVEFIQHTKNHHCIINMETIIVNGELSEADIELAVNGYGASLIKE